jgi:hypothetical protein
MRIKHFLFLAVLMSTQSFSQKPEKKNNFYWRPMINQLSIGYERVFSPKLTLSIEPSYVYSLLNPYSYNGTVFDYGQTKILGFHGKNIRLNTDFHFSPQKASYYRLSFMYQDLSAGRLIYSPGSFAGVDDADYEEYSQHNAEYGVQFLSNNRSMTNNWLTWYVGIGGKIRFWDQHYFIGGTFAQKEVDNRNEKGIKLIATLNVGIRINFVSF